MKKIAFSNQFYKPNVIFILVATSLMLFSIFFITEDQIKHSILPHYLKKSSKNLKVLTFNIRTGLVDQVPFSKYYLKDTHWDNRKKLLVSLINEHNPDIISLQEALPYQIRYLLHNLNRPYNSYGNGRDGNSKGEHSNILVSLELQVLDSGTFWLSSTPSIKASKSYGNIHPRIASFVVINTSDYKKFLYINTHLDHKIPEARTKGAQQIMDFVRRPEYKGLPVIFTGDFNNEKIDDEEITIVKNNGFIDTYYETFNSNPATFHGFTGIPSGDKIDFIFFKSKSKTKKIIESGIIKEHQDKIYPKPNKDPHITLMLLEAENAIDLNFFCKQLEEIRFTRFNVEVKGLCCIQKQKDNKFYKKRLKDCEVGTNGQILANVVENEALTNLLQDINSKKFFLDLNEKKKGLFNKETQFNSHVTFEGTRGMLKRKGLFENLAELDASSNNDEISKLVDFGTVEVNLIHLCEVNSRATNNENDQKSYSSEELKSMVQSRITSPLPKQEKLLFFEEYSGLDLNFKESSQLFEFLALGKFDLIK
ncbi:hypothetical protein HK099_005979 [Clydaea vesicula]|uniref:Endonuclease/exonuclease/phosphatase domain-containing protein n=1 Tax=Clydaea vesicula TaxID=447962 RepID=A0AAD5TY42_9FUNG|nr:hypothetical protein HK099_005979 [Clydaea vesicula]